MPGRRTLALGLFVLVAAVWLPSLHGGFVWDDQHDIVLSTRLHRLRAVVDVFNHPAMWSANNYSTVATYRPLALATLALDFAVYGLTPLGFHITSIILHASCVLALFLALALIVGDVPAAWLALLFAVHPCDAEAVAWINGRSEILALGFGALALWAARTRRWIPLALFLLLSLVGKETGFIFVPLAIALACIVPPAAPETRESLRWSWPPLLSSLAALIAYALLRHHALRTAKAPGNLAGALASLPSLWTRATQAALLPRQRAPVTLSWWILQASPSLRALHLGVAIVLVLVVALLMVKRRFTIAWALAWWLGALAPATAVLALDYPWPGLARWLYVGLPGLLLALYLGVFVRLRPRLRLALALLVAGAWIVAAERAILVWRSDDALYGAMCDESPDDAWAWRAKGITLLNRGRYDEALACFHRVEAIDRTSEIHAAFGLEALTLTYVGRCDEARAIYAAHLPTPLVDKDNFAEHAAACFRDKGDFETARTLYLSCVGRRPACAPALLGLPQNRPRTR